MIVYMSVSTFTLNSEVISIVAIPWSSIHTGVKFMNLIIYGLLVMVAIVSHSPAILILSIHKNIICNVRMILIIVSGTNIICTIFLIASSSGRRIFIFDVLYTIINSMI